jgi:hypothetical protein
VEDTHDHQLVRGDGERDDGSLPVAGGAQPRPDVIARGPYGREERQSLAVVDELFHVPSGNLGRGSPSDVVMQLAELTLGFGRE